MEERNRRFERENARKRENRSRKQRRQEPAEIISEDDENLENFQETDKDESDRPLSDNMISEDEHKMLKKFWKKMDNIRYNTCPICNERIPSMTLVNGSCRRCNTEKSNPKKFSSENNMDPGVVPDELKGLTEIEEMLIAQVFTVMTVYRLRGG